MTILILAGGISKRMWPFTTDKLLIPFAGKPFFYHTLKSLKEVVEGNKVVIVANANNRDGLEAVTKELGIDASFVIQKEAKGMANAVLTAQDALTEDVLVVNGDDLLEPSIYSEVAHSIEYENSDILLVGKVVKSYFPGGYIVAKEGVVTQVVEKPGAGREPSDVVKLVLDYFKDARRLISVIKENSDNDNSYEVALDKILKSKVKGSVLRYDGTWAPLKYPWHILHVMETLLAKLPHNISQNAKIANSAVIEGDVVVEEGVKIYEGATVKGPCYLGKNVVVGNNTLVRESVLEENTVTGFTTEIARSYVGPNSWFHSNYVGDSVIEGDFGMGSGAVIANLRLDGKTIRTLENTLDTGLTKLGVICGKGVRIGINSMTMPGVNIGSGCLIGPGVIVSKNVSENKRILVKQEQVETENKNSTSYEQFRGKLNS